MFSRATARYYERRTLSPLSFAIDKYRSEARPLKLYRTTPLSAEVNKSQCFAVTGGGRHEKEGAAELLGSRTTIRRGRKQNLERVKYQNEERAKRSLSPRLSSDQVFISFMQPLLILLILRLPPGLGEIPSTPWGVETLFPGSGLRSQHPQCAEVCCL